MTTAKDFAISHAGQMAKDASSGKTGRISGYLNNRECIVLEMADSSIILGNSDFTPVFKGARRGYIAKVNNIAILPEDKQRISGPACPPPDENTVYQRKIAPFTVNPFEDMCVHYKAALDKAFRFIAGMPAHYFPKKDQLEREALVREPNKLLKPNCR